MIYLLGKVKSLDLSITVMLWGLSVTINMAYSHAQIVDLLIAYGCGVCAELELWYESPISEEE